MSHNINLCSPTAECNHSLDLLNKSSLWLILRTFTCWQGIFITFSVHFKPSFAVFISSSSIFTSPQSSRSLLVKHVFWITFKSLFFLFFFQCKKHQQTDWITYCTRLHMSLLPLSGYKHPLHPDEPSCCLLERTHSVGLSACPEVDKSFLTTESVCRSTARSVIRTHMQKRKRRRRKKN